MSGNVTVAFLAALLTLISASSRAGDWPQILGPHRNGHADGERLSAGWPDGGPRLLWDAKLGSGFAGPAVVGSRVIVFHRDRDSERVDALNASNGQRLWSASFDASYGGGVNADSGPRCVPVIRQGRVVVFGAAGDLHCVSLSDGKKLWTRRLYREFDGDEGYFGAGATPLVIGDRVLVNIGGRKKAGLGAFSLSSGETLWTATDERASYSSPVATKVGGKTHAIFVTRLSTVSVNPDNGDVYFRFPFGRRGPTVNAATPLVFNGRLFVSASYGVGCRLVRLQSDEPTEIWSSERVMSSQYNTCVYHDGHLYGADGREDYENGKLRCLDAGDGSIRWTQDGFGVAHTILADDKLLLLGVSGKLVLAEASPKAFRRLAQAEISTDTTRALPALSNGRLWVRTNRGVGGKLLCLEVGAKEGG